MGWIIGYDGHFFFENIGDSYIENKVPYLALRAMPATSGCLDNPRCVHDYVGVRLLAAGLCSVCRSYGL
jgi:Dolichyl-phosphate-mannose--protein O-mannosyl transferase